MDSDFAAALGIAPLGYYVGMAVTGCEPDEMGIGPVTAIPRLLELHGLTVDDIGDLGAQRGLRLAGRLLP